MSKHDQLKIGKKPKHDQLNKNTQSITDSRSNTKSTAVTIAAAEKNALENAKPPETTSVSISPINSSMANLSMFENEKNKEEKTQMPAKENKLG